MEDTFLLARGERVREERTRLRLTQEDCADQCGVSRVQWGKYERGLTKLDGNVLKAFAALGADAAYILSGHRDQGIFSRQTLGSMSNQLKHADAMVDVFQRLSPVLKEAVRDLVLAVNVASEPLLMTAIEHLVHIVDLDREIISDTSGSNPKERPQRQAPVAENPKIFSSKVGTVHGDFVEGDKVMGNKGGN